MTEERILDFLDGNLGASEEEELLHRLAVSPERRNLLKQHLQMRELTSSLARRQYVPVPKAVTASLFTALAANGYAGPKMPAPVKSEAELIASLENNLGSIAQKITQTPSFFRRSSIIFASIFSFIAGGILIYFLMPEVRQEKLLASVSQVFQKNPAPAISETLPNNNTGSLGKENLQNTRTRGIISAKAYKFYETPKTYNPVQISDNNVPSASAAENIVSQPISHVEAKYPNLNLASADIGGGGKNPFDHILPNQEADRTILQRFAFSIRSGEGKAPGNSSALSGSMTEVKVSYDITDWLVAKVSIGNFMSYETQAISATPHFNTDGIPLLQLSPVSRTRLATGLEIGAKFTMLSSPFGADAGIITDFQGNIMPRADFFTTLEINDNFDMNIGLEGMLYNHNIQPSLLLAQHGGQHALLIGQLITKETTGFIGPSIEMVWHF